MDPAKIEAIKNRLAPKNVKQLQSFLGLCNYYRRFVQQFSCIAQPLFVLLAKDVRYIWSEECEKAFRDLKNALTSYPVLKIIDPKKPLKAYTDASGLAIGGILTQYDDDGKEYIVACYSRLLNKHEINYSTTEKECLSLIECKREWRNYGDIEFIVDHYALQWLNSIKNPEGRLGRWSLELQDVDLKVTYRPGKQHINADALSRPVINFIVDLNDNQVDSTSRDPYKNSNLHDLITTKKLKCGISNKTALKIKNLAKSYVFDGQKILILKNNVYLEYPNEEQRPDIINKAHAFGPG